MRQERINTLGEIELNRLKILSRRLGVDAVIIGTVEEFDDGWSKGSSVPVVSISARMIDSRNGRIIWAQQKKRTGDDYVVVFDMGRIRSVATLTRIVIKEMIDTIQ